MSDPTAPVRRLMDEQVALGRVPGYAVAVHHAGRTDVVCGGVLTLGGDAPVVPSTPFRLSSVTKLFGAVLALTLVDDGTLALDDPVARWLPELDGPRVLLDRHGPLDRTQAAERPITVRHLLTSTAGVGGIWQPSPLADAIGAAGVGPGPFPPDMDPDTFVARVAALPLAAQPGTVWLYHVCSDLLGVLLARATGRSLAALLEDRVAGPLGLTATGFHAEASVLPTGYLTRDDGGLDVLDPPDGRFSAPPAFESLAAGLVSSAEDVVRLLLAVSGGELLRPATAAAMTSDALTPSQRGPEQEFLGEGRSWGLHVGIGTPDDPVHAGRWGWDGGTGTSAWSDPARGLAAVWLTQRGMASASDGPDAFWRAVATGVA